MKTYFYTIKQENKSWSELPQEQITFKSWLQFGKFCNDLSKKIKAEIRGCESSGYDNQGSYFYNY